MPSYAETYLAEAMENLGEMAHFATHGLELPFRHMWQMFVVSGYAGRFEEGSPDVVAGMSGAELALRSCEACGIEFDEPHIEHAASKSGLCLERKLSPEYWCGWSLAYYQWASTRSFRQILSSIDTDALLRMYPTFHEESELRFAEALEMLVRESEDERGTHLQRQRKAAGLSQSELARMSGVGLRAIQQYEQRAKDINKAHAASIDALARCLSCQPRDILEPRFEPSLEYAVVSLAH